MAETRSGTASIYILVATVIATIVGVLFGYLLNDVITGRRTISILAAAAGIGAEYLVRLYARPALGPMYAGAPGAGVSLPRTFIAAVIAITGGLAAHDLSLIYSVTAGWALGGFAALFAGILNAVLVVLREVDRAGAAPAK